MVEIKLVVSLSHWKERLLCFFKEHKGAVLDTFFFFFGPDCESLVDVALRWWQLLPVFPGLQDIINNTSLAELEKRLKETPFNPPKVGKNINDPRKLHTLNDNYGCLLWKKGKTILETKYIVHL